MDMGNDAPVAADPPPPRRAFVGIGSNVGDRWGYLQAAVAGLPDVVAVSPVYETDPVGGPTGQGAYLNAVVELHTTLSPHELLRVAQRAEAATQRVRTERWGPRTLDVDILVVGELRVDDDELTVPHPRMWERGFVVVPLADLAPELAAGADLGGPGRGVRLAGTVSSGADRHGTGC
ncbi:MAG: 2-amino-4-hydroxy-6-hydroxymethyldihydropteridine diphosphokinase [Actinomycetota bacterium]|nr:2-amino-4-hydroxy-6-hydroxymethyldihydropteridine diphosphokinase [Actinomycetota bacterium]